MIATLRARRTSSVIFALLVLSCGRVYEYPDDDLENTLEACTDGEDTDLDGEADCKDTDCDGFCPEEGEDDCDDRRDNDGDGLTDAADPRCWLSFPPTAERCAEASGVEIYENFDSGSISFAMPGEAWQALYAGRTPLVAHAGGGRYDLVLAFGDARPDLDQLLAAETRARPFSGSWQDFELSFVATVPPQAQLRAGILPLERAPALDIPPPGAEADQLSVMLDALSSPPTLSLDVEGKHFSTDIPFSQPLCGDALCDEYPVGVRVELDSAGFHATATFPSGDVAELRAPGPSSSSLPASRIVFWGGSTGHTRPVLVDDLRVSVQPEWPCGFLAPQIPGDTCDYSDRLSAFGHGVSVARAIDGEYCALVSASSNAEGAPEEVTAWRSSDGQVWDVASSGDAPPIALPAGASLVGAGIAADQHGFHAAVAYREGSAVRLGFADGEDCSSFGELEPGPTLPDDAEAPSYVVRRDGDQALFTLPPTNERHRRTLWRLTRGASNAEPEPLGDLDPDVGAPVSITSVGATDLVLAYPSARGAAGAGLLVAEPGLSSWTKLAQNPLTLPARFDAAQGQKLSFDDRGVTAVALGSDAGAGFLLYSGTATDGLGTNGRFPPSLSVGTARLLLAGAEPPSTSVVPPPRCGDGACSPTEDCSSCEADCPCEGVEVLRDVLTSSAPWEVIMTFPGSPSTPYFLSAPPTLNWLGGDPTWSKLDLERPLTGDFELSFDALAGYSVNGGISCSLYIGLGAMQAGADVAPTSGLFARVGQPSECAGTFTSAPFALTETGASAESPETESCVADQAPRRDVWQHVVLKRRGAELRVVTPRDDGCGWLESSVTIPGSAGMLPSVLVGFGGGAFEACGAPGTHAGSIRNLTLRLPDDPAHCPEDTEPCGASSDQTTCVDTSRSNEHCGACGASCEPNERCQEGACVCDALPGVVECEGTCVNTLSSPEHCGGCGQACEERCVHGACVTTSECSLLEELPPEGLSVPLLFEPSSQVMDLCGQPLFGAAFMAWTPSAIGNAVVELGLEAPVDAVIGYTLVPSCDLWFACNDDEPALELGNRLRFPVRGVETFFIGVGLREAPSEATVLDFSVRLEP